ncbi:MAG TPA: phosphatidylserine decarboxylase [Planctomycetota bacterium]|nr:phosphatidylserine decarboxylase [Planctomycetota bacterium]
MAKPLREWVETDAKALRGKSVRWLSESHFFRDPSRPRYADPAYFFSPADGVILYQRVLDPEEPLVSIKGRDLTLREAMREPGYGERSLVVGIFMTFLDVHVNRIPYSGRLSYREIEPLDSYNRPMLPVERSLLEELRVDLSEAEYLRSNQRVLNRVAARRLGLAYHVLQIADFDVDSITPFKLKQNRPCRQNERFSQIRYGSQVDLIVPVSPRHEFEFLQRPMTHVEAGIDPLVRIRERSSPRP